MRPDDPQMKHPSIFVPQRPQSPSIPPARTATASQQATADIARDQIDTIYSKDPNAQMDVETEPTTVGTTTQRSEPVQSAPTTETPQPTATPEPTIIHDHRPAAIADTPIATQATQPAPVATAPEDQPQSPYERTHDDSNPQAAKEDWSQYHSAWQQYYQQYFQRYYIGHAEQARAAYESQSARVKELEAKSLELTPEQAMNDLRSKLRARVSEQGKKVRRSRHFVPIAAALCVMLIFVFMQYNRIIVGTVVAYAAPSTVEPVNVIADPNIDTSVSPEPRLIIPKLMVDVAAVYENTMGASQQETYDLQMEAMKGGVAWFGIPGADSHPGQNGNTVLSGHSSNDWIDSGEEKYIFARLDKLTKGDTIYANYKGTRYTYSVTDTAIVTPKQLDALDRGNDKPILTLITCTPLGTSEKRLLVFAEQISPDPQAANAAPTTTPQAEPTEIPGVKSSFLGGIFD